MIRYRKILLWFLTAAMILPLVCCAPKSVSDPVLQEPVRTAAPSEQPAAIILITEVPSAPPATPVPVPEDSPVSSFTEAPSDPPPAPEEEESTETAAPRSSEEIVRDILIYYGLYGNKAEKELAALFSELEESDPDAVWRWSAVLDFWGSLETLTSPRNKVLPDGLTDTDELCIVVLGYQLNSDGSMKNELKERLKVALKCAKKYPRAYILCTGGGTASKKKSATEAGQMASWLRKNGVSKKRIIVEDESRSTVQNAKLSLSILREKYPQVRELAIVTSSYHLPTGMLFFETAAILAAESEDAPRIHIVGNASCQVSGNLRSDMYHAGSLIGMSGDSQTGRLILDNEYDLSGYVLPES